ncbi:MAG TPA: hypothetical protein PK031_07985 [Pseudomonadales bacterium]|nr:hypothetical protein [Pseudomonadales bacterium]
MTGPAALGAALGATTFFTAAFFGAAFLAAGFAATFLTAGLAAAFGAAFLTAGFAAAFFAGAFLAAILSSFQPRLMSVVLMDVSLTRIFIRVPFTENTFKNTTGINDGWYIYKISHSAARFYTCFLSKNP